MRSVVLLLLVPWEAVDIIGTTPVNFGTGASPIASLKYYAIQGESIFGLGGAPIQGYSVGLWAKRIATATSNMAFFSAYEEYISNFSLKTNLFSSNLIFAVRFNTGSGSNLPFLLLPKGSTAAATASLNLSYSVTTL